MRGAVEHSLLTLQQLQTHVGCTQVARYAYQVVLAGSVAVNGLALFGLSYTCYADGQTGQGRCGVTTHQIHAVTLTCQNHSCIEILHILHREALAQCD